MSLSNGPDLRGTLRPPVLGHDEKKDTSMLPPPDLFAFAGLVRIWRIKVYFMNPHGASQMCQILLRN
jgi:hypothetical protein